MTGRAGGYCAGYPVPGFANPIPGRGFWGRGRGGGGLGRRSMFYAAGLTGWPRAAHSYPAYGSAPYAPYAPAANQQQEVEMLKGQAEYFEEALDGIKRRIEELEAEAEKK
jgi:hypothetical protein